MYDRFGAKLKELMDASGLSGAELGRRLDGADKSLVSKWKNGRDRPEPATVVKIADVFGVDRLAMLQLAEWLPGEPEPIDARRASIMLVVRDEVPDEELTFVERLLETVRIPSARAKAHRSLSARPPQRPQSAASSADKNGGDNTLATHYNRLLPSLALGASHL